MFRLPWGYEEITIADRINEIEKALSAGLYQAALALALTLPDICGSIEYPKEKTGSRYRKWFTSHIDQYIEPVPPIDFDKDGNLISENKALNAEMCYKLRCAFLHSGNDDIEDSWEESIPDEAKGQYKTTYALELTEDSTYCTCLTDDKRKTKEYLYRIAIPKLCKFLCVEATTTIEQYGDSAVIPHKWKIYSSRKWHQDQRAALETSEKNE